MKIDKSKAIHDAVIEEAEEKGIEKGLKKGRQKEKYNLAHKLMAEDFPVEKVSELTGLEIDVVKKLKKE